MIPRDARTHMVVALSTIRSGFEAERQVDSPLVEPAKWLERQKGGTVCPLIF